MSNTIYIRTTSLKARRLIRATVPAVEVFCIKSIEMGVNHFTCLAIDAADYEKVKDVKSSYLHVPKKGVMSWEEFEATQEKYKAKSGRIF